MLTTLVMLLDTRGLDVNEEFSFIQLKAIKANVELFLRLKKQAGTETNRADADDEHCDAETDSGERDDFPLLGSGRVVRC